MNPIAVPLAVAGLVFYFRRTGARYRLLGWTFVFAYLVLTLLRTKPYFLAPAYPILFAAGAVVFERWAPRPRLAWIRPAYVALLALVGILLAPAVMPILPPATAVRRLWAAVPQALGDRLGWDSLTRTVEQVYAALPPEQRAQACVLTSNYGEAGALSLLPRPVASRRSSAVTTTTTCGDRARAPVRCSSSLGIRPTTSRHVRRYRARRHTKVPVLRVLRAERAHRRRVQPDDPDQSRAELAFGQAL